MTRMSVLLATEGTYPYVDGGVSTWCDILCRELPQVDYHICAVTGDPLVTTVYDVPPNVKQIIHVPLWGAEEPGEYILKDSYFSTIFKRKALTTDTVVKERFLPSFREFLRGMYDTDADIERCGEVVDHMYHYFREYDYADTLRAEPVWMAFKEEVLSDFIDHPEHHGEDEWPNMFDITTCMRWIFNMLMPLNVDIPKLDLVHATIAASVALVGVIAKLEYGTPMVVTDHGVYVRERYIAVGASELTFFCKKFLAQLSAFVTKLAYLFADQISPCCNFNTRWELLWGVPKERMQTIYNGVDPHVFVPGKKPEETRDRPTVVAAARVFPLKDVLTMIRAAAAARESIPNVKFLVYGSLKADPEYVEECRALIKELDLEDTFELAGFHSNPSQIFNIGDISILSSISEGFPYTVLESMSCGTPVVGTDVGGVREALEGFGIVVKPKDPQALGEGVVKLLTDDELRQKLGRMAREEVLAKYRTSISVNAYWETYQRLAAQQRARGSGEEIVPSTAR